MAHTSWMNDEMTRFVDVVERWLSSPDSKAAKTVVKLAVANYRDQGY